MAGSLGDLLVRVGANIEGFEKAMGTVSQRLNAIDRETQRSLSGFDRLGGHLTSIGTTLSAAITLPLAGAGVAVTKFATDFELGMRKVTSLIDNVSQKDFEQLSAQTLKLSKTMGIDAVQATQALYQAISVGVPKENAVEFLAVASKAAIAGMTSTEVAVNGITTTIQAFGLQMSDAQAVADAMFMAVNKGKLEFPELAQAMGIASGTAKILGISYNELLAAATTLTLTTGQSVTESMTMAMSAMKAFIDPTATMTKLLERMGFESGSAAIKALGFQGALEKLNAAAGGNIEVLNAAFGRIEGFRAALGLTGDNAKLAGEHIAALKAPLNASTKAFEEIDKSTARQFQRLAADLKATAIELGTALLPAVNSLLQASKPLVDVIKSMVDWFIKLPAPAQTTALAIAATAAALGPLAVAAGMTISAFTGLSGALFSATGIIAQFGPVLLGAAGAAQTFAAGAITAAIASVRTLALSLGSLTVSTIPALITALSLMAETMLRQAIASFVSFATTAIPAATTALVTFATSTVPAAIAAVSTFTVSTLPAATAACITFARSGIAVAAAAISTFATTTIPAAISAIGTLALTALPLIGVAALTAAAAFAGWNIGKWAYDSIPGVNALGDALGTVFFKFENLLTWIPGVSSVSTRSLADLQKKTEELERTATTLGVSYDALHAKYVSGAISIEQYNKSLNDLVRAKLGAQGAAMDLKAAFEALGIQGAAATRERIDLLRKAVEAVEKAFREGKATADDLAKAKKVLADATAAATAKGKAFVDVQKQLSDAAKKAEENYNNVARAFLAGKASAEQLEAAQMKLRAAQDNLHPEQVIERYARANEEMLKRYDDTVKFFIDSGVKLDALNKQIADSAFDVSTAYAKAYEAMHKASLKQVAITVPLEQRIPAAVRVAVSSQKELEEALKRTGQQSTRSADELWKAYDVIVRANERGAASPLQVARAHKEALEATIEEYRAAGKEIPKEWEKMLKDLEAQINAHARKQRTIWTELFREIKGIIHNFNRDIAQAIVGMFAGNSENDRLRKEQEALSASLEVRRAEWEQYQADVAVQLEAIRAKHAEELANQERDLATSLEQHRVEYEQFANDTIGAIDKVRQKHADAAAEEIADLMDSLREREGAYQEYQQEIAQRMDEAREKHADQLAAELEDLRENLRDKTQDYEDYVSDIETKLGRLQVDTADDIADERRSTDRKVADKRKAFQREEADLNRKIENEQKKGKNANQEQIAEWRRTLQEKREDTEEYIRREEEDYNDFVEEHKRRAEQMATDYRISLERRTRDYQEYVRENASKQEAAIAKHAEDLERELADLQASLDKRGDALEQYRLDVAAKTEAITAKHKAEAEKEVADLEEALAKKLAAWDKYKIEIAAKLDDLRARAKIELEADETKLRGDLARAEAEWEKYKRDIAAKIADIETQFTGMFDRIGEAFKRMLFDAGAAIVNFGIEYLEGKLFKWMRDQFLDEILSKIWTKLKDIFTVAESAGTSSGGGGGGGIPSGGGMGGGAGAAAGGLMGAVNMATGIITAGASIVNAIMSIRQEGTLNAIEHNTRYAMIHNLYMLLHINEYLPALRDIHAYLFDSFNPAFASLMTTTEEIRDMIKGTAASVFSGNASTTAPAPLAIAGMEGEELGPLLSRIGNEILGNTQMLVAEVGQLIDPWLMQIHEMLRGFVALPWQPVLDAASASRTLTVPVYLDGRKIGEGVAEYVTAQLSRDLKIAGQLV